jgi:hypothetical protein
LKLRASAGAGGRAAPLASPSLAADIGKPVATEQDDSLLQLAAAKRRSRQVKRGRSEPTRNPSSIATEEPAAQTVVHAAEPGKVPAPEAKPSGEAKAATEPEPPKPDVWTDA